MASPLQNLQRPDGAVAIAQSARQRQLADWQLVLAAAGIPCAVQRQGALATLFVPAEAAERASAELADFARENRGWPRPEELPEVLSEGSLGVVVWVLALLVADRMAVLGAFGHDWYAAGRSLARAVQGGELWRAATALTLHADLFHLLGNVAFGALFVGLASQVLGTGLALAATFCAGFLGNLINAWVQDPAHGSIGASTAVFGALGVLIGHRARHRRANQRGGLRWIPIAAGVSLGLWLGVGESGPTPEQGSRIDILAHVFGFLAGIGLGVLRAGLTGWQPGRAQQLALGLGTAGLLVGAWALALG
ncbi:MAG TPA: rhomboid family intramembrane serine protease [Planctomycetota bacterium]|nr:rhomboid family intramembrane serine protease [Planctomycetota bacterium]